jgi:hypothetical protein
MRFVQRGSSRSNPILRPGDGAEFFSRAQLEARTIESLKDYLRRRIGGYTVAIKDMPTSNPLYRGRLCVERPCTTMDVSYPRPEYVKTLGRANREGRPMFYACLGAFPVFFEIHAKQGDLVALSEWKLAQPLWMHHLGYHPDALSRWKRRAPLSGQH